MSAWRTQRLTDSTEMSKSDATSACVRSPRRATRTTSRLNSGGNFLGTATSFQQDLVPQMECQPILQQSRREVALQRVADRVVADRVTRQGVPGIGQCIELGGAKVAPAPLRLMGGEDQSVLGAFRRPLD